MSHKRFIIPALLIAALAAPAFAAEVDNPLYTYWARFRPGSYAVYEGTTEFGALNGEQPLKLQQRVRYMLTEVTAKQLVIQVDNQTLMNNGVQNYPSHTIMIPAKAPEGTDGLLATEDGSKNTGKTLQNLRASKENTEVGTNIAEAVVREYVINTAVNDVKTSNKTKAWYVDEVPGGLVKQETLEIGQFQTNTRLTLSEWNASLSAAAQTAVNTARRQQQQQYNQMSPIVNSANLTLPYNNPNASTPGVGIGGGQGGAQSTVAQNTRTRGGRGANFTGTTNFNQQNNLNQLGIGPQGLNNPNAIVGGFGAAGNNPNAFAANGANGVNNPNGFGPNGNNPNNPNAFGPNGNNFNGNNANAFGNGNNPNGFGGNGANGGFGNNGNTRGGANGNFGNNGGFGAAGNNGFNNGGGGGGGRGGGGRGGRGGAGGGGAAGGGGNFGGGGAGGNFGGGAGGAGGDGGGNPTIIIVDPNTGEATQVNQ